MRREDTYFTTLIPYAFYPNPSFIIHCSSPLLLCKRQKFSEKHFYKQICRRISAGSPSCFHFYDVQGQTEGSSVLMPAMVLSHDENMQSSIHATNIRCPPEIKRWTRSSEDFHYFCDETSWFESRKFYSRNKRKFYVYIQN